jgi:AraC family transcriptional regulator
MDRFTAFLRELGTDQALPIEQLAARLHLSRTQLDRIIRARAGETPASFRRRILLERAAYQLRATGDRVLDIAVGAGYSSHEAFTRAFIRAFGRPPREWRADRRSFHLSAPNGVHFFPPAGLRIPTAEAKETHMISDLVDHHIAQLSVLRERAAGLSDEQLDAPLPGPGVDENPTIRTLLRNLDSQLGRWMAAMASEPFDESPTEDPPAFARYVRDVEARHAYGETFVDTTGDEPYVFTAAGMIAHILTYAAYRRTVLVCALDALGAPPIEDDPLVWFSPDR